ncbi:uncharacterized protein LOC128759017 [Synchiropus splendidus]|uniref:uncharacterized protein LOC128759017 n=1 Tax=Synchiropus splendidus TaxID=270530 RepID=UPI00237D8AC0|nr:uncharacterized protein LOC128759017 [Synchiropus splendidus]
MELPLGGPTLRHYTQSRPRPHRQKLNYRPSRPQETIIESENEVLEHMGRVDEGVDEFFSKKVLPADTLKTQEEESITVHEEAPVSSVSCPPPTKTLRRKLGDFFTLRKRRSLKSETSLEGRPKKASIADFIRPLREVARAEKEKSKIKEYDKENEKEKTKDDPSSNTGDSAVQETPISGAPPLRGDAAPPRRALREGKSQSLILLSGSAAGPTNARNTTKKQLEGQHSFEQKLHLMLQRIGVSKPQTGETQKVDREMKKAESEGTIIDNKTEPPPTFSKPRTMSASSDTRHQMRPSASAHESAGKPALPPKPVIKSVPATSTSGRNTPENELTQIQEGEVVTPAKPSPVEAPCSPATDMTIPNGTAVTTEAKMEPPSAAAPPESDTCTDSAEPSATVKAVSPSDAIEPDGKAASPDESCHTTEKPATTPTELKVTDSLTSMSSESVPPSCSIPSTSTPFTTQSTTTTEAPPTSERALSPPSANILEELPVLEATSILPEADEKLSPSGDPISDSQPGILNPALTSDDCSSISAVATNSSATNSSITSTTSLPQQSSDSVTTKVLSDDAITSPSSLDSLKTTTSSAFVSTSGPTASESVDTISTSTIAPVTDACLSSTAPVETPTTSECLTSTADVTAPPDTDLPHSHDTSTTLPSVITSVTDNSSYTGLSNPAPSDESHRQDDCHISSGDEPKMEQRGQDKQSEADKKAEMAQESKPPEESETITVIDDHKDSGDCNNLPAPAHNEETIVEVQAAVVKPEDVTLTTAGETMESPSTTECQKEETKQASG